MPTVLPRFSNLRRSRHNCVRAMPALKRHQNLRQNPLQRSDRASVVLNNGFKMYCKTVF